MPAFGRDPALKRRVGFVDLLFACFITFALVPALALGIGVLPLWLFPSLDSLNTAPFIAFAYTGLLAWMGIPFALLAGWWASRTGRLGWATALVAGLLGGALVSLLFVGGTDVRLIGQEVLTITGLFAGIGGLYGVIGYTALMWLRADLFRETRLKS